MPINVQGKNIHIVYSLGCNVIAIFKDPMVQRKYPSRFEATDSNGSSLYCQVVRVKLSQCLTKNHALKTSWGSGIIDPCILKLGTRWRWVVSLTARPLYPGTHHKRLNGLQSRSRHGDEEKKSHHCHWWELNPGHTDCGPVSILTELPLILVPSRPSLNIQLCL
jgi:hypothetical protein